jgi:hypothetical protein
VFACNQSRQVKPVACAKAITWRSTGSILKLLLSASHVKPLRTGISAAAASTLMVPTFITDSIVEASFTAAATTCAVITQQ